MKQQVPEISKSNFIQWVATFAVVMLGAQVGLFEGWVSPNVARLSSEKSPIPASASEVSWMVAVESLGMPVGAILGSISMEYIGSRRTVFLTYFSCGLNWICVFSANSMIWLYIARFIGGMSASMFLCCFSMYLSEVMSPKIRGTSISLSMTGCIVGILLGLITETYLQRTISCLIYLAMISCGMLSLWYLKDTPYYLMKLNDEKSAKESLEFYRADCDLEKELAEITNFVKSSSESIGQKFRQLKLPAMRKSMLIIIVAYALPEVSGTAIILAYAQVIIRNSGFEYIDPEECVIYINVIAIVAMLLMIQLVENLGRKLSLILSSIGTSAMLVLMGIYFYLLNLGHDVTALQWLPVCTVLGFLVSFDFGYLTVPSTLLSEMFPENMKSVAACLATLSTSLFRFLATKSYQPIVNSFGEHYAYWAHAAFSIVGVPLTLFLLTETKGETLQQIQNKLYKE